MSDDRGGVAGKRRPVVVDPLHPELASARRYLPGDTIDEGGMGVVRKGLDLNLLRPVATKQVRPDLAHDESYQQDLLEEAQVTAQLDHPHIVPVYDLGRDAQGQLFFSMKEIEGLTLTEVLAAHTLRPLRPRVLYRLLQIFLKVCDAVAFAHNHGVIHRDIKPSNVMVGEFGEVYLMDWGLALLKQPATQRIRVAGGGAAGRPRFHCPRTASGLAGTPSHMAPEQARGEVHRVDERTDVFGLGALLYHILVGIPPFGGDLERALGKAERGLPDHCLENPEQTLPFAVPRRLAQLATRAMAVRRRDRLQTVEQFRRGVEAFLQEGARFSHREYLPGELIVEQGDEGEEAYVVVRGRCRVFRRVHGGVVPIRELGPGETFGELAVLTGGERTACVRAVGPVELMVITRQDFQGELNSGIWPGSFLRTLAERFVERDREVAALEEICRTTARAMAHIALTGHDSDDGNRYASWSAFSRVHAAACHCAEELVEQRVLETDLFEIDKKNDRLYVSSLAREFAAGAS